MGKLSPLDSNWMPDLLQTLEQFYKQQDYSNNPDNQGQALNKQSIISYFVELVDNQYRLQHYYAKQNTILAPFILSRTK